MPELIEQMIQLWEYQKKDMALDQFKAQLKDTPTRKRLIKLQRYLKNSQKKINALETEALQIQGKMQTLDRQYSLLEEELDELEKDIGYYSECEEEELAPEQIKEIIQQATALVSRSGRIKSDLQTMQMDIESSDQKVRDLLQKMLSAKKEYDVLKIEHQKELDGGKEEQQRLEEEANAVAKMIPPEILSEYKRIKGFRSNPVAVLEDSRCNGCNMQLPAGVAAQIAKGDRIVTCENCGRILIVTA